jgi:hypothetical protein
MTMEAKVLDAQGGGEQRPARELRLPSGRRLLVQSVPEEQIEVVEANGTISLRVRLTDSGPVLVLEGARLELRGTQAISLAAPRIDIAAGERATLRSADELCIDSAGETRIRATEDVRVNGKLIHLN